VARRNLETRASRGAGPSLLYSFRDVSRWRATWNWFWIALSKKMPWYAAKRGLLRLTGMKVGRRVAIGLDAQFDVLFPQLITLEDDVLIGYSTTILCHEYLGRESRFGAVRIGRGATVGANCTILAGTTIAAGSTVSAMSLVNGDVEGFVGGIPARPLKKARAEGF
jgi:acetyltransferase-like isoleucine patch superfamily enzyme